MLTTIRCSCPYRYITLTSWMLGIVLLTTSVRAEENKSEYRIWTTTTGRSSDVPLRFIERSGADVKLQRESDQKIIALPFLQLSNSDKAYITRLQGAAKLAKPSTDAENLLVSSGASQSQVAVGDWPAWRGAERTGISRETGFLAEWPSGGPKQLWKISGLGQGYSTPAIAGGKLYVLGTDGDQELLIACDVADGHRLWKSPLGKKAGGGGYPGPRGTPTIDGDLIFSVGSDGTLVASRLANGELVWKKNFRTDFMGECGAWDFSESPLIDGDRIVVTPGGKQATLVALNKLTGEVQWKSEVNKLGDGYPKAAYSSPIMADVAGEKQYIQFLNGGVVGVRAKDGTPLWHYDRPANGTANCSTPIFRDGSVFAASGYGTGGGRANILRRGNDYDVQEMYFVNKLQSHHGGVVLIDNYLYGTNDGSLMCVDWKTGDIKWQSRGVGKGSITYAEGHLYVRSEDGPLALVAANPSSYQEHGRFDQPNRSNLKAWAHPVVAGGRLYLRDDDICFCYDVSKK